MNRQTALQAKETGLLRKNRSSWLNHAAVRPVAEVEMLPGSATGGLTVDLTSVPLRPQAQATGQTASRSCPMSPQRCPFGGACHACPPKMQAKLKIGQPGDRYEQEADRVAEQVMRMPEPQVQRKCSAPGCKDEDDDKKLLQTKSAGSAGNAQVDHPLIQNVLSSPGQPLDAGTRSFMEPRFGQDFSGVRVHVGGEAAESARAVNARAYTVGRDVVFGEGQYAPGSDEGKRLVAHELVHNLQQQRLSSQRTTNIEGSIAQSNIPILQCLKQSRPYIGALNSYLNPVNQITRVVLPGLSPGQKTLLDGIFGNSLATSLIRLNANSILATGSCYRTTGNIINMPGATISDSTLIHESAHVWQSQNSTFGFEYAVSALKNMAIAEILGGDWQKAYDYSKVEKYKIPWRYWNAEQQARWIENNRCLPSGWMLQAALPGISDNSPESSGIE